MNNLKCYTMHALISKTIYASDTAEALEKMHMAVSNIPKEHEVNVYVWDECEEYDDPPERD